VSAHAFAPEVALPRLLLGVAGSGPLSLHEHEAIHGELPAVTKGSRRGHSALIDEVELAGLRGRGGAGFPTAVKLRAVVGARGRPIVVVNAAEGEPGSLKDRTLLESAPHLVLDGAVAAAQAVGAHEVIVCVCERSPGVQRCVAQAIGERGPRTDGRVSWHVAEVPAHYVASQESALVSFLNGGPAKPTFTPPRPTERGVGGRPTLVSNAETYGHLGLIARHGPEWFRSVGTESEPGSALITLSGPVQYPGVYEAEHGSPLISLIDAAGGLTEDVRAVLVGGYAGAWVDGRYLRALALCQEGLAPYGTRLGAGMVALLPASACGLAETARVTRWMSDESAGQCGPCVHGLGALATTLEQTLTGYGDADHAARLAYLSSVVARRGACSHPDGAARLVASALEVFAGELADHARHGPCAACSRAGTLPVNRYRSARGASNDRSASAGERPRSRAAVTAARAIGISSMAWRRSAPGAS
jgi:NADH:ubiquinone oxidoreductase subunit F (NADH-binding)